MNIVILAGGTGTRLWPMSRTKKPKQFYEILSHRPMIQDTFSRFENHFPSEKIFISTTAFFENEMRSIFPDLAQSNIIVEPEKRDTAPAMGYVAIRLFARQPDEPMLFVPSDHFIGNAPRFLETLACAEQLILQTGKMVDIGIAPSFPSTVLGYTHIGERSQHPSGVEVYRFYGHREKPPYSLAKEYLEDGHYLWHASYYMWTPRLFLDAYKKNAPAMYTHLLAIGEMFEHGTQLDSQRESIAKTYSAMEKISFDYAITEKMNHEDVLIIKGDFGWSDIGAWDVLYDKISTQPCIARTSEIGTNYHDTRSQSVAMDSLGNLFKGKCVMIDTSSSLIYGSKKKLIAAVGLSDMIVVDTDDALLICPKGKAQMVKDVVLTLQQQEISEFL